MVQAICDLAKSYASQALWPQVTTHVGRGMQLLRIIEREGTSDAAVAAAQQRHQIKHATALHQLPGDAIGQAVHATAAARMHSFANNNNAGTGAGGGDYDATMVDNGGSDSDVAYGPPPTGAGVDAPDMQRTAEAVLSFFDALRGCCIEFGGRVPWDHLVLVNR